MRTLAALALLALVSPLPVMADGDVYQPPAVPGTVAVYRGGSASVASPVTVHRGSAIRPAYLSARAPAAAVETVGGRRIWFVDAGLDQLTSCRVINTFNIGDRRIRCTRGTLPD
jgi:hypothetical protein